MYTVVSQTSFMFKEILIILQEKIKNKKWSEKPQGKIRATFLTLSW